MSRTTSWCYTLNNYADEPAFESRYHVYGREVGAEGTPHLQGYVYFDTVKSFKQVKTLLPTAHWEAAKGSAAQNRAYCTKDGDYTETGTLPNPGKRNDIETLRDAIKSGERNPKRLRDQFSAACKYPAIVNQMLADNAPPLAVPEILLKPWQETLYATLRVRPETGDRTIHFVVDTKGGGGKSTFCNYIEASLDRGVVQVMKPGRYQDMAFELDDQIHILLMDCPRCRTDILQYNFLEDVKDGRVSCAKYQSFQKRLERVHVVCFTNEYPDQSKLSEDRFSIITI